MEKLQLHVPDMYADHHVLKVRTALAALGPGVQKVVASSAFQVVAVDYEPDLTGPDAIEAALAQAGYPAVTGPAAANPMVPMQTRRTDPAWERLGLRTSRTDTRDAKTQR